MYMYVYNRDSTSITLHGHTHVHGGMKDMHVHVHKCTLYISLFLKYIFLVEYTTLIVVLVFKGVVLHITLTTDTLPIVLHYE